MNKKQIISSALSFLALISALNSCAKKDEIHEEKSIVKEEITEEFNRNVTIFEHDDINNNENEKDIFWYTITEDGRKLVDIEKLIKKKLSISKIAIYNDDIKELINDFENYLGDNIYLDKDHFNIIILTNEEHNSAVKMQFSDFEDYLSILYNVKNDMYDLITIEKVVNINSDGTTKETKKSIMFEYDKNPYKNYFINYKNGVETSNSIHFSFDNSIALYNKTDIINYSLVFYTQNGHASLDLTEEEYLELHNLFNEYFQKGNLESFLNDNLDIFKEYALNIKEENQDFYEYIIIMLETSKSLKLK